MTVEGARRAADLARALMASTKAHLCRHGVAFDHCRDCTKNREALTTPAPQASAAGTDSEEGA